MVDGASNRTGSVLAIASLVGAFAACGSRSSLGPGDGPSGGAGGATDSASGGASTASTTSGVTGGAGGAPAECHPGDPPVLLANSGFEQRALVLDADFVYFAPVRPGGLCLGRDDPARAEGGRLRADALDPCLANLGARDRRRPRVLGR